MSRAEHDGGQGLDGAYGQGGGLCGGGDLVGQGVDLGQQAGGLPSQRPARGGGSSAGGVSFEQLGAQATFKGSQAARGRGLGGQQFLGCGTDRAVPGDGLGQDQVFEAQVGGHAPSV